MVLVLKANGKKEEFSENKILASIKRAGLPSELNQEVLSHIKERLYENIPTSEIYRHILEFLDKTPSKYARAKYSLKQSIMDLGPTGYPFEDYLATLLQGNGYKTQTRTILQGKCVSHEIDVIAEKNSEKIMVEAKFHNSPGITTDVHVPLYTKSRYDDLKEKYGFTKVLIITNTKATSDAIAFAQCSEIDIISWSYPDGKSLREIVEKEQMYPITALSTLAAAQKQQLLEKGLVLCKELYQNPQILSEIGVPEDKRQGILEENSFLASHIQEENIADIHEIPASLS